MADNSTPRISVNKLAEYVLSKGGRQRQILRDQKFPTDYKGMYYREASEAVSTCLASSLENTAVLSRTVKMLEQQKPEKIGTQRRLTANIDALEVFESMLDDIDFKEADPELGAHAPPKLKIQNVLVSVRPQIILRGTGKGGQKLVGATKVHFSRTFPLTEESAGYVSAVVQSYCDAFLVKNDDLFGPFCSVIDIGSQTVYPGVKSITARLKDIAAECRNIAALWPTITPDE
jgi:hypothetical protein